METYSLQDIKSRIIKDSQGISDYSNVYIDEMDWMIKTLETYERSFSEYTDTLNQTRRKRDEVKGRLEVALKEASVYRKALREIDTHIRSDKQPVPYIIETLKRVLPEYNAEEVKSKFNTDGLFKDNDKDNPFFKGYRPNFYFRTSDIDENKKKMEES